jgi:hypothetical protein
MWGRLPSKRLNDICVDQIFQRPQSRFGGPGALGNVAVLQERHGQEAAETWDRGKTFSLSARQNFFPKQNDGLFATMSQDGESFAFCGIVDNGRKAPWHPSA